MLTMGTHLIQDTVVFTMFLIVIFLRYIMIVKKMVINLYIFSNAHLLLEKKLSTFFLDLN